MGYERFEIRSQPGRGAKTALILPDIATCPDCLSEILRPANRRYRYPFTNCTDCGPRFSIIEALPYDRPNTSMKRFVMCPECGREYHDPPTAAFTPSPTPAPLRAAARASGTPTRRGARAAGTRRCCRRRKPIGAVRCGAQGLGGFHCSWMRATRQAVARLRERKQREEKPSPSCFLRWKQYGQLCEVSPLEERLLRSPGSAHCPAAPRQRSANGSPLASSLAPGNPNLGVMLPYTPLHHLLLAELGFPVVATSGNLSDEPICTDEQKPWSACVASPISSSSTTAPSSATWTIRWSACVLDREMVLRRARGYAPLPVTLPDARSPPLSADADSRRGRALEERRRSGGRPASLHQPAHRRPGNAARPIAAFRRIAADLQKLYDAKPDLVACDLHPEYLSTKYAAELSADRVLAIQHHYAHVPPAWRRMRSKAAGARRLLGRHGLTALDGTVWGGEFLLTDETLVASGSRTAAVPASRRRGGDQGTASDRAGLAV